MNMFIEPDNPQDSTFQYDHCIERIISNIFCPFLSLTVFLDSLVPTAYIITRRNVFSSLDVINNY